MPQNLLLLHFSSLSKGDGTAVDLPSRGTHLLVTNTSALQRKCGGPDWLCCWLGIW